MRTWLFCLGLLGPAATLASPAGSASGADQNTVVVTNAPAAAAKKVFVLPIRADIDEPMVYIVRRGVKEAIEAQADLLLIHMDTNGGLVGATEEIMEIINRFPGETATFIDRKAFSAGSFISAATQKIFMAPQSVIGAAAPVMMSPGGGGVQDMPNTMEVKMNSAISALVRTSAEKNGHDPDVIMAMIDKSRSLEKVVYEERDGTMTAVATNVLSEKGQILTLTDTEAAREYGNPPRPLLSAGTKQSVEDVMAELGYANATRRDIVPTDMERLASWLTAISPMLLTVGLIALYIEFKTPGFGLPGIVGLLTLGLYFASGYIAGLSGAEWILVFIVGLALVITELFIMPGTIFIGMAGAALMLIAIVMALVDVYPNPGPGPGLPVIPNFSDQLQVRARDLVITAACFAAGVWLLSLILPKTSLYRQLTSKTASGVEADAVITQTNAARLGREGVTASPLRPGGKAKFGEDVLDVVAQGEMVAANTKVRIIGFSGSDPIVEVIE